MITPERKKSGVVKNGITYTERRFMPGFIKIKGVVSQNY
jgi:hypothetical protein